MHSQPAAQTHDISPSQPKTFTPFIPKSILLGIGMLAMSAIWATYNAFVPIFLANKFNLSPVLIGFFMALDNLAALFLQPVVGAWSDRLRTPFGRRLPLILIGAPIAALAFGLIPLIAFLPIFVACTISLIISYAFWRPPFYALIADVIPSRFRSQASGIVTGIGALGSLAAFVGGARLYAIDPAYPFWAVSLLVLLSLLIFLFLKEPRNYGSAAEELGFVNNLRTILRDSDRSVIRIYLAILCLFIAINTVDAFMALYAVNYLGLPDNAGATLLGYSALIYILLAVPAGFIGGRFGRRRNILVGLVIKIICDLALFIFPAVFLTTTPFDLPVVNGIPMIGLFLMVSGAGLTMININLGPMMMDAAGEHNVGAYLGLFIFFMALAGIIGPVVNGLVIQLSGSDYRVAMLTGPIFLLGAFWLMLGVHRGEAPSV